jgi:phosphatidylserine/phosphatidylglycerophosphate/cardiolipin synthase-like enzyme
MTLPFQSATLSYVSGRVRFTAATGLRMPFSGAVIVPKQAGAQPDLAAMPAQESLFVPWQYPAGSGANRSFLALRTMDGARLELSGPLLILVAQDPGLFAEFDLGAIFSGGQVQTPRFPEQGTLTSCRPKTLILQFDGSQALTDAPPKIVAEGTALGPLLGGLPAQLSGTLHAFDFAGSEIEADAALSTLGAATVSGIPPAAEVRVQFVDIFGMPLDLGAIFGLNLNPPVMDFAATRKLYKVSFPSAARKLELRVTDPVPPGTTEGDQLLLRHVKAAVWPGRGVLLGKVTDTAPDLDLAEGADGGLPGFLRLCLYHPTQCMQTAVGGTLDPGTARFSKPGNGAPPNGLALAAEADEAQFMNDGAHYFRDFYQAVEAAGSGDRLYLTNWRADAHTHMLGTLSARGLGPESIDPGAADSDLAAIDQNRIVLPVGTAAPPGDTGDDGSEGDKDEDYLLLPDRLDRGAGLSGGLAFAAQRISAAGVTAKEQSKGFLRRGSPYAIPLKGKNGVPYPTQLIARWKDPEGAVHSTLRQLGALPQPLTLTPTAQLPKDALRMGITNDTDPHGTVIRKMAHGALLTAMGLQGTGHALLVVNPSSGTHRVLDLLGPDAGADSVLGALPDWTGAQDTLYAVVLSGAPDDTAPLTPLIVSKAAQLGYRPDQHVVGDVPFLAEELGGLLRRAISDGVEVRALFWDQFQAGIGGGPEMLAGHSNNIEIAEVINRAGGHAVLDRAMRAFGSFHQKAAVLVRPGASGIAATAWVGGIDLGIGRWDTEGHADNDPDRQSGLWWDVQTRLTGPAAVEVLRNFAQRWRAIGAFIADAGQFADCLPVNASPAVAQDTQTQPTPLPTDIQLARSPEPAADVQITRTIPPTSCHGQIPPPSGVFGSLATLGGIDPAGELGGLAAMLKAIAMARRFILINDQYFFSPEIALALHEALKGEDGPAFLVMLLPRDLSEFGPVDPMLYKLRERALNILIHGGTYTPAPAAPASPLLQPRCGRIEANAGSINPPLAGKVALLYARNRAGSPVYVHSKTMIVDDVWMAVGSTNINYRSTTYDFEINANVLGNRLDFGGTDVVRGQRVELARRMLGLPPAFAALLREPGVMFAHFKALEAKGDSPGTSFYPLPPFSQKLDPAYVMKIGDAAFDAGVDVVSNLGMNDPAIRGIGCAVIDPDGRAEREPLAPLAGFVASTKNAYARLNITVGCQALVTPLIGAGTPVFAEVRLTRTVEDGEGNQSIVGPTRVQRIPLAMAGSTAVISPTAGEVVVPISTELPVTIEARVIDGADAPLGCSAGVTVDPGTETVLPGSFRTLTLAMA